MLYFLVHTDLNINQEKAVTSIDGFSNENIPAVKFVDS